MHIIKYLMTHIFTLLLQYYKAQDDEDLTSTNRTSVDTKATAKKLSDIVDHILGRNVSTERL